MTFALGVRSIAIILLLSGIAASASLVFFANDANAQQRVGAICGFSSDGEGTHYRMRWVNDMGLTMNADGTWPSPGLLCSGTNEVAFRGEPTETNWKINIGEGTFAPVVGQADRILGHEAFSAMTAEAREGTDPRRHPTTIARTATAISREATAERVSENATSVAFDTVVPVTITAEARNHDRDATATAAVDINNRVNRFVAEDGLSRGGSYCGHAHNNNGWSGYGESDGRGNLRRLSLRNAAEFEVERKTAEENAIQRETVSRAGTSNSNDGRYISHRATVVAEYEVDVEWSTRCDVHFGSHESGESGYHTH